MDGILRWMGGGGGGGGGGTDGPMGSRSQQADRAPSSNDGHFMLN